MHIMQSFEHPFEKKRLKMIREELFSEEKKKISDWCCQNNEGDVWVVKASFTTNKNCRYFANSIEKVL